MSTDDAPELASLRSKVRLFSFYVIFMTPTDQWAHPGGNPDEVAGSDPSWEKTLEQHLLWLRDLERRGVLFLSGPLDRDEWDGTGMAVIRAESREQAEEIAEGEPFHVSGMRSNRVRNWKVNEGCLQLTVRLFDDTVELR